MPAANYASQPPFVSFFDDGSGQDGTNISIQPPQSVSISNSNPCASNGKDGPIDRVEKLRRQLAALLPSQHDVDILSDFSYGWWIIQRHIMPHLLNISEDERQRQFDVATVSRSNPMVIARLLLCITLCIQQLPPNIDLRRLQTRVPLREMMEQIMAVVTATVTSDDELTGSIEGIDCLILQAIYQINAGNFRRSWLIFRRAIGVAQLMGLHRVSFKTSQAAPDLNEAKRHYMWYQIMRGERYLSLMLGVPSATSSVSFPFDDHAPGLSLEDFYNKHLCSIAGLILTRNQGDATHAFSATQEIDQKLDSLAKQMPPAWWELPTSGVDGRTDEAANQFEQIICQIWHFELETLVHLPFMLRAATDRRYEYSRISCLNASRGLIKRWMFMREAYSTSFVSNVVEFQAFTAAITILLGLIGPTYTSTDPAVLKERVEDLQLIEKVVHILEELKQNGTGAHVVNQSISVIRTLQGVLRNEGTSSGNLRLTIQHFGTISIARGGAVQSLEGERILGANPQSDSTSMEVNPQNQAGRSNLATGTTSKSGPWGQDWQSVDTVGQAVTDNGMLMSNAVMQFTSSQFPTFESGAADSAMEWPLQDSDNMLFDSLLNTDVDGNWAW